VHRRHPPAAAFPRLARRSPRACHRHQIDVTSDARGIATWDRLAEHLEQTATGKRGFVINRTFDAPIARVFEMLAPRSCVGLGASVAESHGWLARCFITLSKR
jgi:hypothetical protein